MSRKIQTTSDAPTTLAEIIEQQRWIDELAVMLSLNKEAVKESREEWEAAVERLGAIIRDNNRPLLSGVEDSE